MTQFSTEGSAQIDEATLATVRQGFISASISDSQTEQIIRDSFYSRQAYLLDPHTAVAVAAAQNLRRQLPANSKVVCLATAHPAKFPEITRAVLSSSKSLPEQGRHPSLEAAAKVCQKLRLCSLEHLEQALVETMQANLNQQGTTR